MLNTDQHFLDQKKTIGFTKSIISTLVHRQEIKLLLLTRLRKLKLLPVDTPISYLCSIKQMIPITHYPCCSFEHQNVGGPGRT